MAIANGEYGNAITQMNNINDNSEEAQDFVATQQINIQKMINQESYIFNNADRNLLWNIAHKNHTYAGYARALYYYLTGELIMPDIVRHDLASPRSNHNEETNFLVYPNPISNTFKIENSNETIFNYSIYDIYGRQITSEYNVVGYVEVNTSNLVSGMYLLKIYNENGKLFIKNLIK